MQERVSNKSPGPDMARYIKDDLAEMLPRRMRSR
jgi:hypothetical protein